MNKGFTLIELLIVISIFIILAAVSIPVYGNWQSAVQMDAATAGIAQAIRLAKTRGGAGFNDSAHGVYFNVVDNKYILYQGNSYAGRDADYDQEVVLENSLTLSGTLSNGEVNFSRGLGVPSATGTVIVAHSTTGEVVVVSVNGAGMVDR